MLPDCTIRAWRAAASSFAKSSSLRPVVPTTWTMRAWAASAAAVAAGVVKSSTPSALANTGRGSSVIADLGVTAARQEPGILAEGASPPLDGTDEPATLRLVDHVDERTPHAPGRADHDESHLGHARLPVEVPARHAPARRGRARLRLLARGSGGVTGWTSPRPLPRASRLASFRGRARTSSGGLRPLVSLDDENVGDAMAVPPLDGLQSSPASERLLIARELEHDTAARLALDRLVRSAANEKPRAVGGRRRVCCPSRTPDRRPDW